MEAQGVDIDYKVLAFRRAEIVLVGNSIQSVTRQESDLDSFLAALCAGPAALRLRRHLCRTYSRVAE